MYGWVEQEHGHIQRVKQEIEDGNITDIGYHTSIVKNGEEIPARGLHLFNTKLMVGDLLEEIESIQDISGLEKKIKDQLKDYWSKQINEFASVMVDEGLITFEKGEYVNRLAPNYLFEGLGKADSKMNTGKNFLHNLGQVYMNLLINSTAINKLVYGDMSRSFSDPIDIVKRMAGANASGPSMSAPYAAPEWGINHPINTIHHITYRSEKVDGIDIDDGQMYGTEKTLRYMLFGFGKLNQVQVDVLDKLKDGKPVTEDEFFNAGGLKDNGAFNSYKLVYFDGSTYLKCSMFPLFKEATSYKEDGIWKPLPWTKEMHDLRETLERVGNEKGTVVFAHPVSVSKGLKRNVAPSIGEINNDHFNKLESKFMRQQLENPSNKIIITDPTQAKQQIMNEQDNNLVVNFFGVDKTIGDIKHAYLVDESRRVQNSYNGAANSIFNMGDAMIELSKSIDENKLTPKLGAFINHMRETLQATGSDQQTLGFLETENGEPIYNLNFPSILEKYTQVFLSYFSRGVLSEKTPGLSLALVSGANGLGRRVKQVIELNDQGQPKRWKTITTTEFLKNPDEYKDAHRWSDASNRLFSGLSEGDYYIDDLQHNYEKFDENGKSLGFFSEYIRPAHYLEEFRSLQKDLSIGFGIRIPSDDKHSYITLEMVDTLPVQYGSVAIFPHELIRISGADFDIDKEYVSIPDTYVQKGQRIAYGTAITPEGQYKEFITWQYDNNKQFKKLYKSDEFQTTEEVLATLLGSYNKSDHIQSVLKQLGLPTTVQEFIEAGGPDINNGVLNNRVLQARIAMRSNSHIAKGENSIANQPTSTDSIIALVNELVDEFSAIRDNPEIVDKKGIQPILNQLQDTDTEVFSLMGMTRAFGNMKEGSRNIGAAANSIQAYSLLNEANIPIDEDFRMTFNNHEFTTFGNSRTWNGDSYSGERIFAILSTLLNAMTDNGKNPLAAKLGLNITALGYVSNMVAQGVPLKTCILLMLQPSVQKYFKRISALSGSLKTAEESRGSKSGILNSMIDESLSAPLDDKSMTDNITTGGLNKELESSVLKTIRQIEAISSSIMNISKVQKLSQGLPTTWEDIDKITKSLKELGIDYKNGIYSNGELPDIAIDVRDLLLRDHLVIATNIKALGQIQQLGKKIFLEKTPLFQRVTEIAIDNIRELKETEKGEFNRTLKHDIISFLSIKSYMKWLNDNAHLSTLSSLNQALIYPEAQKNVSPDYKNIIDIVNELKNTLVGKNRNFLVSNFLLAIPSNEGKTGINEIQANTWARLSEQFQDKLIGSFIDLYSNAYTDESGNSIETHDAAVAMFNYLLVKDGGQFRSNTFIRYIPNFVFRDIMDRTTEINDFLSDPTWDEQKAQKLFGVPSTQILDDFMRSYGTHIGNKFYIQTIKPVASGAAYKTKDDIVLSKDDQKRLNNHALVINKPILFDSDKMHITIFQGTTDHFSIEEGFGIINRPEYKKKLSPLEKEMIKKNKAYIQNAGFKLVGNNIGFPYSVQVNGTLYILKNVGKQKSDSQLSMLINKEETIPNGVSATYIKSPWLGAKSTWKGSGVFGLVPIVKISENQKKQNTDTSDEEQTNPDDIQAEQYQEQQDTKTPQQELLDKGITTAVDSKGRTVFYKEGKLIATSYSNNAVQEYLDHLNKNPQQNIVSSQSLSPDQWKSELNTIYQQKKSDKSLRDWMTEMIAFRDRSREKGATDEQILNTIKCL